MDRRRAMTEQPGDPNTEQPGDPNSVPAPAGSAEPTAAPVPPTAAAVPPTVRPVPRARRPIIERLGLALIAIVIASLIGAVTLAAWAGGEPFLTAMGAIGCAMTLWVGGLTLFRG